MTRVVDGHYIVGEYFSLILRRPVACVLCAHRSIICMYFVLLLLLLSGVADEHLIVAGGLFVG